MASTSGSTATSKKSTSVPEASSRCVVNGRTINTKAVVSNANLRATIFDLVGEEKFDPMFVDDAQAVRLNNSSTQVYMALRDGDTVPRETGDLLFSSTAERFQTDLLLSRDITSRTFSFYYPDTRPEGKNRTLIVSSTNANYDDWAGMSKEEYEASKQDLVDTTLDALEKYVPNCRERIVHAEAATPVTFEHYTKHLTVRVSEPNLKGWRSAASLPEQIPGLYHAGSCGIIMSGWLGTINYGVIVANDVINQLSDMPATSPVSSNGI